MSEDFTPDNLITDDFPIVTDNTHIIASGETMVRGAVLGKKTTGGQLKVLNHLASDGSEVVHSVALEAVDASSALVSYPTIALSGGFNSNALSFAPGATTTAEDVKVAARAKGIYFRDPSTPVE